MVDLQFPLSTASLPLAAVAEFALPVLLPFSAALFVYTAIPSFKGRPPGNLQRTPPGRRRFGYHRGARLSLDGRLVFAGSVLCWCLGLGRILFKKTQDDSKKMLDERLGKAPRFVWLSATAWRSKRP